MHHHAPHWRRGYHDPRATQMHRPVPREYDVRELEDHFEIHVAASELDKRGLFNYHFAEDPIRPVLGVTDRVQPERLDKQFVLPAGTSRSDVSLDERRDRVVIFVDKRLRESGPESRAEAHAAQQSREGEHAPRQGAAVAPDRHSPRSGHGSVPQRHERQQHERQPSQSSSSAGHQRARQHSQHPGSGRSQTGSHGRVDYKPAVEQLDIRQQAEVRLQYGSEGVVIEDLASEDSNVSNPNAFTGYMDNRGAFHFY